MFFWIMQETEACESASASEEVQVEVAVETDVQELQPAQSVIESEPVMVIIDDIKF